MAMERKIHLASSRDQASEPAPANPPAGPPPPAAPPAAAAAAAAEPTPVPPAAAPGGEPAGEAKAGGGFRLKARPAKKEAVQVVPPGVASAPPAPAPAPAAAAAAAAAHAPAAAEAGGGPRLTGATAAAESAASAKAAEAPAAAEAAAPHASGPGAKLGHKAPTLRATKTPDVQLSDRLASGAPPDEGGPGKPAARKVGPITPNLWLTILLFVLGETLSSMPAIRAWSAKGQPPVAELGTAAAVALVVALLVLARRKPLQLAAGVLLFVHLVVAAGLAYVGVAPEFPKALEPVRDRLPQLGEAAGAFLLFAACLIVLFGTKGGQWAMGVIVGLIGLAMPWVPIKQYLPALKPAPGVATTTKPGGAAPGATGTAPAAAPAGLVATTGDCTVVLPKAWQVVTSTAAAAGQEASEQSFKSADGQLAMSLASTPVSESKTFADYVVEQRKKVRARYPNAGEMEMSVPGKAEQRRVTFVTMGGDRIEMLVVNAEQFRYALTFAGRQSAFDAHRAEVSEVFDKFEAH